jgi:uncharacterized membrane protein
LFAWVSFRLWIRPSENIESGWPETLFLLVATATTLTELGQRLPAQNVALVGIIIVLSAAATESINAVTGMPFGPRRYTEQAGRELFELIPWWLPLAWLVILINARGTARLLLRPWRNSRNYGLWLLAVSVLLVVSFEFGFEPFATQVQHYWRWSETRLPLNWYTTPAVAFLGFAVTALVLLAFSTPPLINKRPSETSTSYSPLLVWLLLNWFCLAGAAKARLWNAGAVISAHCLIIALFAAWTARRTRGREMCKSGTCCPTFQRF